jgi:predicted glutamine amidotransferase
MGLLLACMISRPDLLGAALLEEREAIDGSLPVAADGWGAGFYQSGEALHRKLPQPIEGHITWGAVLDGLRSHVTVAHVREATIGDRRADNTQPFRMRQWLFAHVGEIAGYDATRARMLESLPDFLRRNIRGQTDSELFFHLTLSFLHDSGQLDAVDVPDAAVVSGLRSAVALTDRYSREVGATPGSLTMALTNGRQLYLMRRGSPLCIASRDRLPQRGNEMMGAKAGAHQAARYVMAVSYRGPTPPTGYTALVDSEVVSVDRDLQVVQHRL